MPEPLALACPAAPESSCPCEECARTEPVVSAAIYGEKGGAVAARPIKPPPSYRMEDMPDECRDGREMLIKGVIEGLSCRGVVWSICRWRAAYDGAAPAWQFSVPGYGSVVLRPLAWSPLPVETSYCFGAGAAFALGGLMQASWPMAAYTLLAAAWTVSGFALMLRRARGKGRPGEGRCPST